MEKYNIYNDSSKDIMEIKAIMTLSIGECNNIESRFVTNKKYKDFTLSFLASDKNENCLRQCVIEVGGTLNENLAINEMFDNRKFITYSPIINSILDVESLSYLMCDYNEQVINSDRKNIRRFLKFIQHIGVITEIKQKRLKITQAKPIKKEYKETEISFDIETFNDKNNKQISYLICWKL